MLHASAVPLAEVAPSQVDPAHLVVPVSYSAPLHPALGGDLLLTVEAVRPVLVVLDEVLGSQLQAVDASGHQGRAVCEDRGHGVVAAQGRSPGP